VERPLVAVRRAVTPTGTSDTDWRDDQACQSPTARNLRQKSHVAAVVDLLPARGTVVLDAVSLSDVCSGLARPTSG
jgi:hypothetical protein